MFDMLDVARVQTLQLKNTWHILFRKKAASYAGHQDMVRRSSGSREITKILPSRTYTWTGPAPAGILITFVFFGLPAATLLEAAASSCLGWISSKYRIITTSCDIYEQVFDSDGVRPTPQLPAAFRHSHQCSAAWLLYFDALPKPLAPLHLRPR